MPEARGLRLRDMVILLLLALGFYAAWYIREIILILYVSIIFAIIFTPAVGAIQRIQIRKYHPGRGAAILILAAILAGIVAVFGLLMLPPLIGNIQEFAKELPRHLSHLADKLNQYPLGKRLAQYISPESIQQHIGDIISNGLKTAQSIASVATDLVLFAILVAYFMLDGRETFNWSLCLVPARKRGQLQKTLLEASQRVQRWIYGQLLLMLILGSSSFVVFWILGVRYFYALALFAGLANFVPILGPLATVIVAGAVAAMDSWLKLLGVVIFYVIYQQVENAYLTPRIMKATVDLPAIAVIVALAIGGSLAGILGAIVAVPSAALAATVINEYMVRCDPSELKRVS